MGGDCCWHADRRRCQRSGSAAQRCHWDTSASGSAPGAKAMSVFFCGPNVCTLRKNTVWDICCQSGCQLRLHCWFRKEGAAEKQMSRTWSNNVLSCKKKKKISHPTFQCMTYRSRFVCRCVWFLELFFFFTNKRTWQLDGWRVLSFLFLLSVPEQCCNKANRSRNNSCEKTNCQSFYFFPLSPLNLTQRQCVTGQQWLQRVCSLFI